MILFTQSTAVLHKYLNDKLKILCLLQFFPEVAQKSLRIEFSMFREIPEYPGFSRFVATLFYRPNAILVVQLTYSDDRKCEHTCV